MTGALCLVLLGGAVAAEPAPAPPRSLLVVSSDDAEIPAFASIAAGIRAALQGGSPEPVAIYAETLDRGRFGGPEQSQILGDFVRAKYRDLSLNAIVAVGDPTLGDVLGWRDELWPGVPIVFLVSSEETARLVRQQPGAIAITFALDVAGTLRAALALRPDTERVAVVSGHGDEQAYAGVRRDLLALKDRVELVELTDLTMAELRRRVAALPPRTIILYTSIYRDAAGQVFVPRDALALFAPDANCPIFSYARTYLGQGIVGGSLLDFETLGREAGERVLRILAGQSPASIPTVASAANQLLFDGREMDRFGLKDAQLPPGSQVLFRPQGLWEEHRRAVLGSAGLLALQLLFIVELVRSRRRLEESQERLRLLSRRLITAQEEERSRIARDLHDDASQRLALLAIELDELAESRPGAEKAPARTAALAGRVRTLSSDLLQIAYDLHPQSLDHLGLVPAARRFAEALRSRHGLEVEVLDEDWPAEVPRDVALVLYRVCQEALQSVVKQGGGQRVRVSFQGQPDGLAVVVSDVGLLFGPEGKDDERGLRVEAMRQRLQLVGGELDLGLAPSGGTAVLAWVPR